MLNQIDALKREQSKLCDVDFVHIVIDDDK